MRRSDLEEMGWCALVGRYKKLAGEIQLELVHLGLPVVPSAKATDKTCRVWVPPWFDYFLRFALNSRNGQAVLLPFVVAYQSGHEQIRLVMDAAFASVAITDGYQFKAAIDLFQAHSKTAFEFYSELVETQRQKAMESIRIEKRVARAQSKAAS